ncbi:MAG: 3-hydroxy-3-methylglutaryl CoA synthase [Alphaproteobacteria bacterium]|nr:3-hydroxy-3-methylglutaryl CoA synthase [Alphaproteobacteria bacterium]
MSGIISIGGYIPRLRLQRKAIAEANAWFNPGLKGQAKAERAICNWDEDAVTMAVEAARDALTGIDRSQIDRVVIASTTLPFQDRQCAPLIAQALHLRNDIATLDLTTSQRAGTTGLMTALQAPTGGLTLVIAAEKRRTKAASPQEMSYGDGAAAMVIGANAPAARLIAAETEAVDFVDHFRGQSRDFDYVWEERWIRDEGYNKIVPPVVARLLKKAGVSGDRIAHFVMPCTLSRVAQGIAKKAGIAEDKVRDNLHAVCGDTGVAHPLVMLAHALEDAKAGDLILVAAFGQGCDALLFEATPALAGMPQRRGIKGSLARRKAEGNYQRFLAFNDNVVLERGMRAEGDKQTPMTTAYRKRDMITSLMGGKCRICGTVQWPKANVCVNPNCNAFHSQDDHPFSDQVGKVMSFTADQLTYCPDPPACYGMVTFEEGGRFMADFTDVDAPDLKVGMRMRMMFRIKEVDAQRGFVKYFWKAAPAA